MSYTRKATPCSASRCKSYSSPGNQRGFTIIEMLVAIAVASILMIGIMTFLTNTLVNNSIRTVRADMLREAQLTLDVLTKDIRLSASVDEANRWEDDNSPNAAVTDGLGWESDSDTLILATAAEDSNNDILFQDATHYITHKNNNIYYLQNGSLFKRTLAAPVTGNAATTTCPAASATATCLADRELAKNVSGFSIHYYNSLDEEVAAAEARSVEVTLTLSKEKYNRNVTAEYTTRTVFRNE